MLLLEQAGPDQIQELVFDPQHAVSERVVTVAALDRVLYGHEDRLMLADDERVRVEELFAQLNTGSFDFNLAHDHAAPRPIPADVTPIVKKAMELFVKLPEDEIGELSSDEAYKRDNTARILKDMKTVVRDDVELGTVGSIINPGSAPLPRQTVGNHTAHPMNEYGWLYREQPVMTVPEARRPLSMRIMDQMKRKTGELIVRASSTETPAKTSRAA